MFSDKDFKSLKDKDYSIIPFNENNIHPIGYDLTIGELIFSKDNGMIHLDNEDNYIIKPFDTIHILTNEIIWLSGRVSGTLHSRTSLAFKGFSNISTTVDPKWIGQLLVTMSNLTDKELKINKKKSFCTLNIHKLNSPTETILHTKSFIVKYLTQHISNQNNSYLNKVQKLITEEELERFKEILTTKNIKQLSTLQKTISKSEKKLIFNKIINLIYTFFSITIVLTISVSIFKWDLFKPYLQNLQYDSTIFAMQISVLIAIVCGFNKNDT